MLDVEVCCLDEAGRILFFVFILLVCLFIGKLRPLMLRDSNVLLVLSTGLIL